MANDFTLQNDLHPTLPRWFAMYTHSRQEKKVFQQLTQLGYEAYLPLRLEVHQWSDRKKKVEVPLFPSYVFARLVATEYYEIPKSVKGFMAYVTLRGHRIAIRDNEIQTIKLMLQENQMSVENCNNDFSPGQNVRIIDGPLIGMQGILTQLKGRNKVMVRIESMDTHLAVEIAANRLTSV